VAQLDLGALQVGLRLPYRILIDEPEIEELAVAIHLVLEGLQLQRLDVPSRGQVFQGARELEFSPDLFVPFQRDLLVQALHLAESVLVVEPHDGLARGDLGPRPAQDGRHAGGQWRGQHLLELGHDQARGVQGRGDLAAVDHGHQHAVAPDRRTQPGHDGHQGGQRDDDGDPRRQPAPQGATAADGRGDDAIHGLHAVASGRHQATGVPDRKQ